MFKITVDTPATFQAVSAEDMDLFLRLNDSTEDPLLTQLASAAQDMFEVATQIVLCDSTLKMYLESFPTHYVNASGEPQQGQFGFQHYLANSATITAALYIPRYPITSISLVEYLDVTGTWQTLSGCTFDLFNTPARIILPTSLPQLHLTQRPCVRVTFQAGYHDSEYIPPAALVGIKLLAAHWYGSRSLTSDVQAFNTIQGWEALTARFNLKACGNWNY